MTAEPTEQKKPLLDVIQIQELLPHRPPFLLVDRVISLEKGKKLVAWKGVTMNEPFFPGHFPDRPVMPGVLILEALAQACALLALLSMKEEDQKGKLTYLMGIDAARFRRLVVPGDRLELQVEVVKQKGPVWKMKGTGVVDGEECAGAEFLAMLVDPKAE
jgi:3-hydroxyacyl-[acyl-carrier-protein] dehydratase